MQIWRGGTLQGLIGKQGNILRASESCRALACLNLSAVLDPTPKVMAYQNDSPRACPDRPAVLDPSRKVMALP